MSERTDRDLLRRIERSAGQRAGYKQLVRELGLGGGRERRMLLEQLQRLTTGGQLIQPDRDHWALPQAVTRDNLAAGRLDMHRDGYGFVRPQTKHGSTVRGNEDDIFIPPNELNGAMQGDQVLVELAPPRADGRRSGRIARILTRRNPTVVGRFHYAHGDNQSPPGPGNYVTPFDDRMREPIFIPPGMEQAPAAALATPHRVLGQEARHALEQHPDLEGLIVDVEITDWPSPTRPARGRVIEVLGEEDGFGVDVEIVIRKHHLPHIFPDNVLAEARQVARLDPAEIARRRDFRHLPIVTIDGETARDFDDAVFARQQADGSWELQVHIADVAQYVAPASAIDLEARLRGTSVYFPDRAVPMLPQELSTDICSLRPHEDRLVLSCLMRIDAEGNIQSYEITEGVIRSARRMTYTEVHAILDNDPVTRAAAFDMVPEIEGMYTLARLLNQKRQRRGSIDFDLPEPVITFDPEGSMQSIVRSERSWANRLIEEFMLAANESVASWLEHLGVPSLYRIHEKPEPRRVVEFEEVAAGFGYSLGLGSLPVKRVQMKSDRREHHGSGRNPRHHEVAEDIAVTPRMYQKLAARISGKPEERILAYLMLRSLKQARYSEQNEGHFALAAPSYTHFTSPIRRYPDLIVHRIAKAVLHSGISGQGAVSGQTRWHEPHSPQASHQHRPGQQRSRSHDAQPATSKLEAGSSEPEAAPIPESELAAIADETSQSERRADEAERELMEWKKVKFMQDRVGEDFDAMIMSVTKYGCFVELDSLFVEGLVPIASLHDDHYTFRENTRQIIGEHTHRRYSMGDRVKVVLNRIDAVQRRLQFSILEEIAPTHLGRPGKSKSKKKSEEKSASSKKSHPYKPPKNKTLRKLRTKHKGRKGK